LIIPHDISFSYVGCNGDIGVKVAVFLHNDNKKSVFGPRKATRNTKSRNLVVKFPGRMPSPGESEPLELPQPKSEIATAAASPRQDLFVIMFISSFPLTQLGRIRKPYIRPNDIRQAAVASFLRGTENRSFMRYVKTLQPNAPPRR
jgi:hypothetical protein